MPANTTNRQSIMKRPHLLSVAVAMATTVIATGSPGFYQDGKPTTEVVSCTTSGCHSDVVTQKVMHAPVAESKCMECHDYAVPAEHLFVLKKPNSELCLDCHKPNHLDRVIHKPVADGDCLSCHDPHGSEHPTFLRKDQSKLCLDCHEDDYSEFDFVHGPVAVGACVLCHDSHSSSYENLLTDRPSRLCTNCHEEVVPQGVEVRRQHKPMEDGCVSCHNPHASNSEFQLISAPPKLCINCHEGFEELFETAHVLHGPVKEIGGCTECHNPHFSKFPKLQKQTQPGLCLKCHDQEVTTKDGRVLTDMAKLLEENPDHHGPIREGACSMCHHPHAADESNLLLQAYPPEFYAPYDDKQYKLCFTCHESDLVEDESGTGLTGFRQGDKNLHWLHVNQEKGRTCRACHEVHASKQPFHIRESVPFGKQGWMLDLNFKELPDGGSCSPGCHKPKEYWRNDPPVIQDATP